MISGRSQLIISGVSYALLRCSKMGDLDCDITAKQVHYLFLFLITWIRCLVLALLGQLLPQVALTITVHHGFVAVLA